MSEFNSIEDVLNYREDILVIDLSKYYAFAKDDIEGFFKERPKGLYVPGITKPFFVEGKVYYNGDDVKNASPRHPDRPDIVFQDRVDMSLLKPVTDLKVIRNSRVTWYDEKLQVVATKADMMRLCKIMTDEAPRSINTTIVVSIIDRHMVRLCHKHHGSMYHRALDDALDPKYRSEMAVDIILRSFGELLDTVDEFIGRNTWSMYSLDVRGTSLYISKGIDWRIYDWYRMKFEAEERKSAVSRGEDF